MRWSIRCQKIRNDKVLEDGNYEPFEFDTNDPLQALSNYLHKHSYLWNYLQKYDRPWNEKYDIAISLYQADVPHGIHRTYKLLSKWGNEVKQITSVTKPRKFKLPPSQYEAKSEEEVKTL